MWRGKKEERQNADLADTKYQLDPQHNEYFSR